MQALNESFARLLKEIEALLEPSPVHVERWVFLDATRAETRTVMDAQASIELGYHQISERIRALTAYREASARFQADVVFARSTDLAGAFGQFDYILHYLVCSLARLRGKRVTLDV